MSTGQQQDQVLLRATAPLSSALLFQEPQTRPLLWASGAPWTGSSSANTMDGGAVPGGDVPGRAE